MTLTVFEDVICRVHNLKPDDDCFLSECASLSTLLVGGRIDKTLLYLPKYDAEGLRAAYADAARDWSRGKSAFPTIGFDVPSPASRVGLFVNQN